MQASPRQTGEFCWINILTPAPEAAREFYAALFGWNYVETPGGHIILVDDQPIGGLWDVNGPQTPPGTPAVIGVMVKVTDADATSARSAELGGEGKPGFDIPPQGRMAECIDPNGARIDVWQPGTSPGATAPATMHGVPSWFETITSDVARARAYYEQLFGWTSTSADMGGFAYTTFSLGEMPVAGMMPLTPEMAGIPSHWGVYVTVDDVDAATAKVTALGGTIFIPPMDIPTVGRFSGMLSPQGVRSYLITYLPRA